MTSTREGADVASARSHLTERDEYPSTGGEAISAPRLGLVMGPTPCVHLANVSVLSSVLPLPAARRLVSPMSPVTAAPVDDVRLEPIVESVEQELSLPAAAVVASDAATALPVFIPVPETVRAQPPEWKPVDPQSARAVLRVQREGAIHHGPYNRTRRPRPPQLSSGDATERMRRLQTIARRRQVIMVAASVLVTAGLLSAIWHFTMAGYAAEQPATSWNQVSLPATTAGAPAASRATSASASATGGASTTQASQPTEQTTTPEPTLMTGSSQVPSVLRANAIYGEAITGSCPESGNLDSADNAKAALTSFVDCMNNVWRPIIEASNIRFRPATIYFYANTTVNGCSTLNPSDPISAMYCPMDATIYISPIGVANSVGSRFYGAELVTHEYAHHVQALTQILAVAGTQGWSKNEYSRRIQLQAHCLSFAVLNHVGGFNPDLATFRLGWQVWPGSDSYGSIASIQYWGEKGLAAMRVGDCDTFSAPQSAVA